MKLTAKSIALTALLAVSSGVTVFAASSQVSATIFQASPANSSKINSVISASPSIVGNWKGKIVAKGDDAATILEINVLPKPGSIKQGTWKFWGSNNNQDVVYQSGTLVATVNNNNVVLELKEQGQSMIKFQTKITNNKELSGESLDGNSQAKVLIYLNKTK
ncbi:hypothetical protein [Calothrix sp. PCC 6303]|uniref:hypothetical protein n=1 Tax=Calothrix sp. PCC 6303 TaxID=1170562 RepID=UPI0002A051F4|nr:hypothetical protein [Calothrix sp. PCC 6303]AFZ00372.1 hypothetical protein Cal6303_1312 [Calothrix sp. PCC 6303]